MAELDAFVVLRVESPLQSAGKPFRVTGILADKAEVPLQITFEKQRITIGTGGYPVTCPIDVDSYFAKNVFAALDLDAGTQEFSIEPEVKLNAASFDCGSDGTGGSVPVSFPDHLLISVAVKGQNELLGRAYVLVTMVKGGPPG